MKSLGILRRVDELGRIVLPKELRISFDIIPGDALEIYTEKDGSIILKKYQQNCVFCGADDNLQEYKNKLICLNCIKELYEQS